MLIHIGRGQRWTDRDGINVEREERRRSGGIAGHPFLLPWVLWGPNFWRLEGEGKHLISDTRKFSLGPLGSPVGRLETPGGMR